MGRDLQLGDEPLTIEERLAHYSAAASAFGSRLSLRIPEPPQLGADGFRFPLLVHLRALLDTISPEPATNSIELQPANVLDAMLRREATYWARAFERQRLDLSDSAQRRAVCLSSLVGAGSRGALKKLLRADDDLEDGSSEHLGKIADAIHDLYPGRPYIGALEPDLLTEQLVAGDMADAARLIRCFQHKFTSTQSIRMLSVLLRALASPFVSNRTAALSRAIESALEGHLPSLIEKMAVRAEPLGGPGWPFPCSGTLRRSCNWCPCRGSLPTWKRESHFSWASLLTSAVSWGSKPSIITAR